jgi:hypothetical protein
VQLRHNSWRSSVIKHARFQPLLDEPYNALIANPVLDELHRPFVRVASTNPRMSASSTWFTFLVTMTVSKAASAVCWPKAIRDSNEFRLTHLVQHHGGGPLDNLVFENGHPDRPLSAAVFWRAISRRESWEECLAHLRLQVIQWTQA